jgi:hypothetical protein
VVRGAPRRRIVEESLEELDLVLVGPKPLEQPARVGPVPGTGKLGFVDAEESDREMRRKVKKAREENKMI